MANHDVLLQIVAVLLGARMFGGAAVHFGMPPVLGEILAGAVLGPSLLGWVEPNEVLTQLAEIGLILLLFDIGSGTNFERLLHAGSRSLIVAVSGFLAPLLAGFALAYTAFGLTWDAAWFVGGTLTATSIGITLRILKDLRRDRSREAAVMLGAAVLDDVFGILLLTLLHQYAVGGEVRLAEAARLVLLVVCFVLLAPIAARLISLAIERFDLSWRRSGLIPTSVVALVLVFAWLASQAGAPPLLGGFAAGLALSRRFRFPRSLPFPHEFQFDRKVRAHMRPIVQLMSPVFFVTVGVSLDIGAVGWGSTDIWLFTVSLLLVAVAGKLLGPLALQETRHRRWAIGIAMVPRGELGIVFADFGRASGILDQTSYAAVLLVIVLTTLLTPLALARVYRYHGQKLNSGAHR